MISVCPAHNHNAGIITKFESFYSDRNLFPLRTHPCSAPARTVDSQASPNARLEDKLKKR